MIKHNAPNSFIDLEYLIAGSSTPALSSLPFNDFANGVHSHWQIKSRFCADANSQARLKKAGHAPFRAEQLYNDLVVLLAKARHPKAS